MIDHHSPFGSGPAPIGPRDIIDIADEVEDLLKRDDRAFLFAHGCDKKITTDSGAEPITDSLHEDRP